MVKKNSFGKMIMKTTALAIIAMFLLGFAFPTITALITQEIDPNSATGSPVKIDGKVYGSYLLAEAFNSSIFFQARPSGIGFNLSQSGGPSYSHARRSGYKGVNKIWNPVWVIHHDKLKIF